MDLFKQCLKDSAITFIFICSLLIFRIVIPIALLITPMVLVATLSNWFWLLLYFPFGYIACFLITYFDKKGYYND